MTFFPGPGNRMKEYHGPPIVFTHIVVPAHRRPSKLAGLWYRFGRLCGFRKPEITPDDLRSIICEEDIGADNGCRDLFNIVNEEL